MTRPVSEVAHLIRQASPANGQAHLPLTDEAVRQQTEKFAPTLWLRYLPAERHELVERQGDRWASGISRGAIFEQARTVDNENDALELYLLATAWGTGKMARPVWRSAQPLKDPEAGTKLLRARDHARESGAVAAYWRMLRGGANSIKGLGPSFFTKWLYFSAYDGWDIAKGPAPLILDARVARALGWTLVNLQSRKRYEEYFQVVQQVQDELRDLDSDHTRPHCIEHALFTVGK